MKTKPIILDLLAILYLAIPLSMPIQISLLYGHGIEELHLVLNKLSFTNIIVMVACFLTSYLLYTSNRFVKLVMPITLFFIVLNNAYVSRLATDFTSFQTTLASVSIVLISSVLLFSEAQIVLSNQNLRWWQIPKRFMKTLPVRISNISDSHAFLKQTETYDISATGMFIRCEDIPYDIFEKLTLGSTINITLNLNDKDQVHCDAEIVRTTGPKGSYPAGVGLKFRNLDLNAKWQLSKNLSRYKYLGVANKAHYTGLFM